MWKEAGNRERPPPAHLSPQSNNFRRAFHRKVNSADLHCYRGARPYATTLKFTILGHLGCSMVIGEGDTLLYTRKEPPSLPRRGRDDAVFLHDNAPGPELLLGPRTTESCVSLAPGLDQRLQEDPSLVEHHAHPGLLVAPVEGMVLPEVPTGGPVEASVVLPCLEVPPKVERRALGLTRMKHSVDPLLISALQGDTGQNTWRARFEIGPHSSQTFHAHLSAPFHGSRRSLTLPGFLFLTFL